MGHGIENRVVGSRIDALNAQEDEDWTKNKGKKNKKKKKHKGGPEVNKKNILGGEGGLLDEEFHAEKWVDEKIQAQILLDSRIDEDRFMQINDCFEVITQSLKEEIPQFDKSKDSLFSPDHIVQIPKGGKELTIEHLLDNYFMTRMLNNQDNNYQCAHCRKEIDMGTNIRFITKFFRIHCAPKHLAISLKRFKMIPSQFGASFEKNNSQVNYGLKLDLSKYILSK